MEPASSGSSITAPARSGARSQRESSRTGDRGRWTREAAADLERIADYLFQHVPDRAADLVRAVYDAPALLLEFPHRAVL